MSSKKEMTRLATTAVIARVADLLPFRNRAVHLHPDNTGDHFLSLAVLTACHHRATRTIERTFPNPATRLRVGRGALVQYPRQQLFTRVAFRVLRWAASPGRVVTGRAQSAPFVLAFGMTLRRSRHHFSISHSGGL